MPKITVYLDQKKYLVCLKTAQKQFLALLKKENIRCDEVIIHFITSSKMRHLHKKFFNDPSDTDCITFPINGIKTDNSYTILGEIFICPKTAHKYAKINKIDYFEELTLYLVHGFLHLIGYNDLKAKDQKQMRQKEKECLVYLKNPKLL
ncbi:MAG: rRNA maturation RNase YbeY [Chlamydiae bacterium]|nr:rRNA maturation RNase YbeY [Chlamydiota bacterium]